MKDCKSRIQALIDRADNLSDRLRSRVRKVTGFISPLMIVPHLGYGTPNKLLVNGRVLEDEGFTPAKGRGPHVANLTNMYRRFETDEVPGARIRALFQGMERETITD